MQTYLLTYETNPIFESFMGRSETVKHVRTEKIDKDDLANTIADLIYVNGIVLNVSPLPEGVE